MSSPPSTKKRRRGWAWTLTITAALLAVVWVGSMKVSASVDIPTESGVDLASGAMTIYRYFGRPNRFDTMKGRIGTKGNWDAEWWFSSGEGSGRYSGVPYLSFYRIPLWPFVLLTGVPGVWMLAKTRTHTNPHACPACGYDRTGLPQSSTGPAPCPECGKGKDENR